VLPLLAAVGAWRVLGGFALGAAGWVVTGLLLVGPEQMVQWPRLVLERHVDEAFRTAGVPGIVTAITGSGEAAFVAAVVLAGIATIAAFVWRRRLGGRAELAVAVGIAVSLACAPHVFPDDLMLLAVPVVIWAPLAPWAAAAILLALSAAYELDGRLPSSLAHLTAVASVAVCAGLLAAVWPRASQMALPRRRAGAEGTAPAP
jgi:hypothetical protein